jgi:hypothetical protein
MSLLKRSCVLLEEHARAHDYPCIGVLLELENERFRERAFAMPECLDRGGILVCAPGPRGDKVEPRTPRSRRRGSRGDIIACIHAHSSGNVRQ